MQAACAQVATGKTVDLSSIENSEEMSGRQDQLYRMK